MQQVANIPAPAETDKERFDIWLLWRILSKLEEAEQAETPYVSVSELRDLIRDYIPARSRKDPLTALKNIKAVGLLNARGTSNQKYFIKDNGRALLALYTAALQK